MFRVTILPVGIIAILFLLTSCALIGQNQDTTYRSYEIGSKNLQRIIWVNKGMSIRKVENVMGTDDFHVQTGFFIWHEILLNQPFLIENKTSQDGKEIVIYYYWTKTKEKKGFLTPIVFVNKEAKAIGWNNDYLPDRKAKEKKIANDLYK